MASNDYFMRQVEGVTDMLSSLVSDRKTSGKADMVQETQISQEGHLLLMDMRPLVAQGLINEAENLLFEEMEKNRDVDYLPAAEQFYSWLSGLCDEDLRKCNFSREEIEEGRKAAKHFYED